MRLQLKQILNINFFSVDKADILILFDYKRNYRKYRRRYFFTKETHSDNTIIYLCLVRFLSTLIIVVIFIVTIISPCSFPFRSSYNLIHIFPVKTKDRCVFRTLRARMFPGRILLSSLSLFLSLPAAKHIPLHPPLATLTSVLPFR